jgi:hypothetical protein
MNYFRNLICYILIIVLFMQYDNNNSYIVQKLFICSNLTTSFTVTLGDKKVTCIEVNNTISSFSPVDHMLQVNF